MAPDAAGRTAESWDQRYLEGNTPWDHGEPCRYLVEWIQRAEKPQRALVIGCGSGANVVWLAQQGIAVTATDISAQAIAIARERAQAVGVDPRLLVHDIQQNDPVDAGSVDFVFDRGVYHVFDHTERARFAERVAISLGAGGRWLSLSGNADEPNEGDQGPPRLTAREVIAPAEPLFELLSIRPVRFQARFGPPLFWETDWKKRTNPT